MTGEVAFGAAISEDRQRAAIVAAGWNAVTGRVVVDLVWYEHPSGVVAELARLHAAHAPVAVAVNPKSQSGTLVKPLAEAGIFVLQPSAQDVAVAHGEFLDLVNNGGLEHLGQPEMTAAVRGAQQRPLAGAKAWEPRVPADQSPLAGATWAVWALLHRPPAPFFLTSGPDRAAVAGPGGTLWPVRNPGAYQE